MHMDKKSKIFNNPLYLNWNELVKLLFYLLLPLHSLPVVNEIVNEVLEVDGGEV